MKRTEDTAREYRRVGKTNDRIRLTKHGDGSVTARVFWSNAMCATPCFELFDSFEHAIRCFTRKFGTWERVEYRTGAIGW